MKNKTTAALLGFFLGGLGVHRFYLGQMGRGFMYLIFCWTFIPAFLGAVDAIVFLLMSEEKFNIKYNWRFMQMNQGNNQPNIVINTHNTVGHTASADSNTGFQEKAVKESEVKSTAPEVDKFEKSGDEKYADYDFDGALSDYKMSLNIRSKNPGLHFKVACIYSLLEKVDEAIFHLDKAVELGFYDLDEIRGHDHLAYLRSQPIYESFVQNGFKASKKIEVPSSRLDLNENVISQIEKLAELKDKGIIDADEFQAQKTKLLNG